MSLGPRYSRNPTRVAADVIAGPMTGPLKSELLGMAYRLAEFQGDGATPQPGREIHRMTFGGANVLVEFEIVPANGDGWNEPRHERKVYAVGVLINGAWCDVSEVVPHQIADAWIEQFEAMLDEVTQ